MKKKETKKKHKISYVSPTIFPKPASLGRTTYTMMSAFLVGTGKKYKLGILLTTAPFAAMYIRGTR